MLTLYRPFTSLLRDEFFGDRDFTPWSGAWRSGQSFNPAVDIVENENAYLVKAELPGLAPENIDVQVENDVLTVRGERRYENEEERSGYRRVGSVLWQCGGRQAERHQGARARNGRSRSGLCRGVRTRPRR